MYKEKHVNRWMCQYLENLHDRNLPTKEDLFYLRKCLAYLFENNCLSKDNVDKLILRSEKNNLPIKLKYLIIKNLSYNSILNQYNFDNIFNHFVIINDKWKRHFFWINLFKTLLKNNLITQDNLDKILLYIDFKNLIEIFNIFSPDGKDGYGVFNQDFIFKITSQNNLENFKNFLWYIPNSVWQNTDDLTAAIDKLVQCNAKLGQNVISIKNLKLNLKHEIFEIFDKCISAPTSEAAAAVFIDKMLLLKEKEYGNTLHYHPGFLRHKRALMTRTGNVLHYPRNKNVSYSGGYAPIDPYSIFFSRANNVNLYGTSLSQLEDKNHFYNFCLSKTLLNGSLFLSYYFIYKLFGGRKDDSFNRLVNKHQNYPEDGEPIIKQIESAEKKYGQ